VGFEYESDARRFWGALHARLEEFALSLHPDKTRLIEFGRFAADRRARAAPFPDEGVRCFDFAMEVLPWLPVAIFWGLPGIMLQRLATLQATGP
jgi:hypothetical protein